MRAPLCTPMCENTLSIINLFCIDFVASAACCHPLFSGIASIDLASAELNLLLMIF